MTKWNVVEERDFNMIKKLPELNTPNQIYLEWTKMEESVSVPDAAITSNLKEAGLPSIEQLRTFLAESYSILDTMLTQVYEPNQVRCKVREMQGNS